MGNKKLTQNEKYLSAVFQILKKRDGIIVSNQKTHFNDTELRLLGEVLVAKQEGKRLISTQIATRLGVTRSAISQIVNRLEAERVVKRVSDDVDRKIAYIEITDETLAKYEEDIKVCADYVGNIVEKYGKEKFETMCALVDEFMECITEQKKSDKAAAKAAAKANKKK